jgi:hypothetical protein
MFDVPRTFLPVPECKEWDSGHAAEVFPVAFLHYQLKLYNS